MRTEWVTLIKTTVTDGTFQEESPVSSVSCWAELKSVARSEFYEADAAGWKADAVFDVSPIDYDGHQKLVHHAPGGDVEYRVVRDYKTGFDSVELTCSRITG